MKTTILLCSLFIWNWGSISAQSWKEVGKLSIQGNAFWGDIEMVSPDTGWVVMANKLAMSVDGGETWEVKQVDTYGRAVLKNADLHFINNRKGFLLKYGIDWCLLYKTEDGGARWERLHEWLLFGGISVSPAGVHFFDENIGLIRARYGRILRTVDGGANWQEIHSPVFKDSINLHEIGIRNTQEAWMVGDAGTVLRSMDQGLSWEIFEISAGESSLREVSFKTELHGYITGQDGRVFRTKDGGKTWELIREQLGESSFINSITFHNEEEGYLVGGRSTSPHVLFTEDGGESWEPMNRDRLVDMLHIESISSVSNGPIVALGIYGFIYKLKSDIPKAERVEIYPNPSNNYVIVDGELKGCRIRLLSPGGEVLYELLADSKQASIPLANLGRGWYIIEVIGESGTQGYRVLKN